VRQFWVASRCTLVVASYPPCPFPCCAPHHRYRCSTRNTPHEQLLIGLEAGGALLSVVCHSFVVLCHSLLSVVHCLLYIIRLSLSVIHCLPSVVCRSFVIVSCQLYIVHSLSSVVCRLASIIPTYPPCEQWLTVAGVGADM
jgi:hypothetical protein